MKILMVCLGNICRSPLAEGIMQHKIDQRGLNWTIDSAGTGSWHVGERPDPRSIAIAQKYGVDISHQRARQFQGKDLQAFDLVFAMDSSNYNNIRRLATNPTEEDKVSMIMNMVQPGYNESVPDPYYDDQGFERVYQMLDRACDAILDRYA